MQTTPTIIKKRLNAATHKNAKNLKFKKHRFNTNQKPSPILEISKKAKIYHTLSAYQYTNTDANLHEEQSSILHIHIMHREIKTRMRIDSGSTAYHGSLLWYTDYYHKIFNLSLK